MSKDEPIQIPGTKTYRQQIQEEIQKAKANEDAEAKGRATMATNYAISGSVARAAEQAKMHAPTFETDAWYISNGTKGKSKDDQNER